MGLRGVVALGTVIVATLGAGGAYVLLHGVEGSADQISRDYFDAWRHGSFGRMERLAADPPSDFADQHRALSRGLSVSSVILTPGPVTADAKDRAHVDFQVTRDLAGHGDWSYRSSLRLGVVDDRWKVLWSPDTLYPGLRGPATWRLKEVAAPDAEFVARDGKPLPEDGTVQSYITALADRVGGLPGYTDDTPGWAVELEQGDAKTQRVKFFGTNTQKKIRLTLDRKMQGAAEKAVEHPPGEGDGGGGAAIVALRPSTGEILAVADRTNSRNAFLGHYPPGSTFKVVTAAALLSDGMSPSGRADCPGTVVTGQRTIRNHDGQSVGGTTLRTAFAQSCNTTFARLAVERLGPAKLTAAAGRFGFGGPITPGEAASRGNFPDPRNTAELAEAAFGQGRVEASPLMMATVAAAVADGTWRSPRMVDKTLLREVDDPVQPSRPIPAAAALRTMMRAVVTDGTAARAGLPSGTAGKTGTAEVVGSPSHAWFIGYRGDLAFAVLVANGGSGPDVAAPLAARFLKLAG